LGLPVLADTDVLIDYLRGRGEAVVFVRNRTDRIVISAIVVAELYAGVKGDQEEALLEGVLAVSRVLPVTAEIARASGLLKGQYAKSHGVGLSDAIVAATAQVENAELATLNVKHYPMFRGLKPAYVKR
jgi:predicted nucleic acid-binding protein